MALASTAPETLGVRVRRIRVGLGLTQREFAAKLQGRFNKSPEAVSVSRWERDVNPPALHYLRQIAALGETTVGALLEQEED